MEKTCKNCFHYHACSEMLLVIGWYTPLLPDGNAEKCDTFVAATDVVPKTEVERLEAEVADLLKDLEVSQKLQPQLLRAKTRCRELNAALHLMREAANAYKRRCENAQREGTWVVTENGCVITCSECGYRLELCYPDGTEVRWLPGCPNCRAKMGGSPDERAD